MTTLMLNESVEKIIVNERDHSIKTRLTRAKEQSNQPTVAEGSQYRAERTGKKDDD